MSLTARYRFGKAHSKTTTAPKPPQPSRLARNLALAYLVERLIEEGVLENYSSAARLLSISRARLSQIANLRWLAPGEQEGILRGGGPDHLGAREEAAFRTLFDGFVLEMTSS